MSLLIGSAGKKFFNLVVLRKNTYVVVDFELKKFSLGNLTKSFFSNLVLDSFY